MAADPVTGTPAGLLLLADSRFPAGAHAHSGGVEALVDRRLLVTPADLALLLDGRLRTAGLVGAAFAAVGAAPAAPGRDWRRWDHGLDVRTPSPAAREASRAQGAALLRTALRTWPRCPRLRALADQCARPHQPLALGTAAWAAGADAQQAAVLAVHHLVGGASTAAVRLLGLDPLAVAAVGADLVPLIERTARRAGVLAERAVLADEPDLLPSDATPLPEILAELHRHAEVTLFAS